MDTISEIKEKMAAYCAYQDRSYVQIQEKLHQHGLIPEAFEEILLYLRQHNFFNEARFAHSYARGKFYQKKWGKLKISQGLKQHQIPEKLSAKALTEIDPIDYQKCIAQLIIKKKEEGKSRDQIYRYLLQKGYSYEEFQSEL